MTRDVKRLVVFAASPNDVQEHREALHAVIEELNQGVAADRGFFLQLQTWADVAPDMGRPEQVILDQIRKFDIFIGMMGRRFGSPTGKYEGGTEEEFYTAYERWEETKQPRILFYFNQEDIPLPRARKEVNQLSSVLKFRGMIEKLGLVREYRGRQQFVDLVRKDLTTVLRDFAPRQLEPTTCAKSAIQGDYWEVWRDAALEDREPGERVETAIYRSAELNVKFMTISGRSIYSGNFEEILTSKSADFTMNLLLFDWNSPELPDKMRDERRANDVMIEMAREKANSIARQFLVFAEGLKLNLQIKLYSDYPVWRLLIADNSKAFLGYYPTGMRGYEGPMFVFQAVDNATLFQPVKHYFNTVWTKSGPLLTLKDPRFELLPLEQLERLSEK